MADPIISEVVPARGATGGQTLVEIRGQNFQLPGQPVLTNKETPALPPTVRVFFGGVEAKRVRVASSSRLVVTTAPHVVGVADVEVRNVGEYGETLGSPAIATGAFSFIRPDLTRDTALATAVKQLRRELVNQVHPEVVVTQSVDWTDTPGDALRKLALAKLPSIILAGPRLRENRNYRTNVAPLEKVGEEMREYRAPDVKDLIFTLGALAETMGMILAMTHALTNFITRNPVLRVPRSPNDPAKGFVEYELRLEPEGDMTVSTEPSKADLKSSTGTIAILGVLLEGLNLEGDMATDMQPPLRHDPTVVSSKPE